MSYTSNGFTDIKFHEEIIFERSRPGRCAYSLPAKDLTGVADLIPADLRRKELDLPELSEIDVVRHYTRLSTYNFSIDHTFYPLGSCTMKYNPKINEKMARLSAFTDLHPETPLDRAQGTLKMMFDLQHMLAEVSGFAEVSLNPAAGAHGEYTGLGVVRKYHQKRGDLKRKKVIIPDSAHGTNPASCAVNGFEAVVLESGPDGKICLDCLKGMLNDEVAAIMLTNPNTLGVFETDICAITKACHDAGALVYGDGANLNAILGVARPGDMGIDVMHFNLHKTFSTPHGGGGPGSGPVGVAKHLVEFLPNPVVRKNGDRYEFALLKDSMGRVRSFYGNVGIALRAYVYLLELGKEHIAEVAEHAVLNANYIKAKLKDVYNVKYPNDTLHETVFDDSKLPNHVTTMDVAKGLIDRGYHPPTVYFPLIVHGALMVEPTETESKETMDGFIDALKDIAEKAASDPQSILNAPTKTYIKRPDETLAARKPVLKYGAEK